MVGEKLVRLVSLLRLLHVAPLVGLETDAEELSDLNLNGLALSDPGRLYVWARQDAWLCHPRYCAVRISALQRDVTPVVDPSYRPKLGSVAAGERASYASARSRQDAAVQAAQVQLLLRLPDWLPGAAGPALLRC
ncbi:hypothetical protein KSF_056250 [Reticulibacter mediterranei]|uniref:Uncharacterized protein n=1 Tax=Reticulibacter mediterranei TaxID=2778369 RepID=A0A8J3IRG2_9CHLR|nr:hypothetical protein KSF_056250 [Reticulibacter mediterranei]